MCGIAGIVRWDGRPVREDEIRAMCGVMVHRGPDDEGVYVGDGVALGMRRLSIIDLDSGHQPISNEDGTVWIVFNGEIYNYRELRRELEQRGHTFRTASDTEAIVHLYEDHGPRCVERLRGMFAFAIWDTRAAAAAARARPPRHQAALLRRARRRAALRVGAEADPAAAARRARARLGSRSATCSRSSRRRPRTSIVEGVPKLEPARVRDREPGTQHPRRAVLGRRVRARTSDATEGELVERAARACSPRRSRCTWSATCRSARS